MRQVSALHDHGNDLRGNADNIVFLVFVHDRRVIFEPLCVRTNRCNTLGCLEIADRYDRLPGTAVSQWIVIHFYKAVDGIDARPRVCDPRDVELIEIVEIAGPVILDELVDPGFLRIVFGDGRRFLEPRNDLFDRRSVHAADLPHPLHDFAVDFRQLRVQPPGHGSLGVVVHLGRVEFLYVIGGYAAVIICRGVDYLVDIRVQGYFLGGNVRVEHHGPEHVEQLAARLAFIERQFRFVAFRNHCDQRLGREFRQHLVHGVMVVNAVCEPHALGVLEQLLEILCFPIAAVGADDCGKQLADAQIVLVILVVNDVSPGEGCLRQVKREFLFPKREFIEAGDFIPK